MMSVLRVTSTEATVNLHKSRFALVTVKCVDRRNYKRSVRVHHIESFKRVTCVTKGFHC